MTRKVTIKRKRARRKVEPVKEPEAATVATQDFTSWRIAELREELVDRGLEPSGRKSELVKRLLADDAGAVAQPAPSSEVMEPTPSPVEAAAAPTLADLFVEMQKGDAISVTRISDDNWLISSAGVVSATPADMDVKVKDAGLRGDEYWREVLTLEYYGWYNQDAGNGKPWSVMTAEEKVDFADDLGVEWEEHDDARVSGLRMVRAIFDELGIVKYKAEYKSKKSRDALR